MNSNHILTNIMEILNKNKCKELVIMQCLIKKVKIHITTIRVIINCQKHKDQVLNPNREIIEINYLVLFYY